MNRITATWVSFFLVGCGAPEGERATPEAHERAPIAFETGADDTHVDDTRVDETRVDEAFAPDVAPPILPSLEGDSFASRRFTWRRLDGQRYWQIASHEPIEDPRAADEREGTRGTCPAGMVHVEGNMRVDEDFEAKQQKTCSAWLNRGYPERCAAYDEAKWRATVAEMDTVPMAFCIDRFEYPNLAGQYPAVVTSYQDAQAACGAQGKRVCGENEWTFACEGEDATPYPNGYERDAEACSIDAPGKRHDETSFLPSRGAGGAAEMDRLWQGRRSGDSPQCKSSFGVHDMTGNVDEWTTSSSATGRRSILKGGYWGPVRARCRPSTRSHGEQFRYYQMGFRCCADQSVPRA